MKNFKKFLGNNLWKILLGIQGLASIVLLVLVYLLDILPMLYLGIVIVILVLLMLLSFFLMKRKKDQKKDKVKNIIGKIVSVALSILLIVGSVYISQGTSTLNSLSDANVQTNTISAIVLDESEIEELAQCDGSTFGINPNVGSDILDLEIESIEETIGSIETNDYDEFVSLATALYDEEVDVIIMDEAYRTIVESEYEDFQTETRVIWQYSYDTEVEDFAKEVDVTNTAFSVYISGIDTTGAVSTVSRSDVNMIITVNPTTKQILLTSIPRDYYVTLANNGEKDKLTHAGIFGVQNSVETVENLLGIEINYYAKVNFTSLVDIVDALGGITVYCDQAVSSFHTGSGSVTVGYNEMDGELALTFCRERYAYSDGDNHRVKNQQEVIKGIINKVTSTAFLTNYSSVLSAVDGSVETNFSTSEITSLIKMQINDMADWEIQQCQLTGSGTTMYGGSLMPNNKLYYMIPDDDSIEECVGYINSVLNGEDYTVAD